MPRKTPILLRRAPFGGEVMALTNYRHLRSGVIRVSGDDGKHDVTADFNDLVLETLFDGEPEETGDPENCPSPDIIKALDYAVELMLEKQNADPEALDLAGQTQAFRKRLMAIAQEHNERCGVMEER